MRAREKAIAARKSGKAKMRRAVAKAAAAARGEPDPLAGPKADAGVAPPPDEPQHDQRDASEQDPTVTFAEESGLGSGDRDSDVDVVDDGDVDADGDGSDDPDDPAAQLLSRLRAASKPSADVDGGPVRGRGAPARGKAQKRRLKGRHHGALRQRAGAEGVAKGSNGMLEHPHGSTSPPSMRQTVTQHSAARPGAPLSHTSGPLESGPEAGQHRDVVSCSDSAAPSAGAIDGARDAGAASRLRIETTAQATTTSPGPPTLQAGGGDSHVLLSPSAPVPWSPGAVPRGRAVDSPGLQGAIDQRHHWRTSQAAPHTGGGFRAAKAAPGIDDVSLSPTSRMELGKQLFQRAASGPAVAGSSGTASGKATATAQPSAYAAAPHAGTASGVAAGPADATGAGIAVQAGAQRRRSPSRVLLELSSHA